MSAVLRASGPDFDVVSYAIRSALPLGPVYRKGDRRVPCSRRAGGDVRAQSGFNLTVSEAEFDDFPTQASDAIVFLKRHEADVVRLTQFPGVEGVEIDFGVSSSGGGVQSVTFPSELVALAGRCGIALTLSRYEIGPD